MGRRKPDPIESWSGSLQSVTTELAKRVEKRGGDLVVAVSNLAKPEHGAKLDQIAEILVEASRTGAFVPTRVEPGVFRYEVNYTETIADKLKALYPNRILWAAEIATDDYFPDVRKGKRVVIARAVNFDEPMSNRALKIWCQENGKVLARPKELIDLAKAFPGPALGSHMPLAASGQLLGGEGFRRIGLSLGFNGEVCGLDSVLIDPDRNWNARWYFLVLDK